MSTLTQNERRVISTIKRIAKKTNCPFTDDINLSVVDQTVKILASNDHYASIFAAEISRLEKIAVNSYTSRGDSGDKKYESIFNVIEYIFKCLHIELDYGVGLYPTFEIPTKDGYHTEYSPLNALRFYNDFWNNKNS